MKIRNGFISNSSSSSFIISKEYNKEDIMKYVKEQTLKGAVQYLLNDIKYTLTSKDYTSYTMEERVESCKRDLDRFLRNYSEKEFNQIKISKVKEMFRSNNEDADFDISEWYENLKADNDDWIVYDEYDNFIPDNAGKKIIEKFKCIDYNLHMG